MTAKKKIPLVKSSFFWNKIADVIGLLGTGGLVTLDLNDASEVWTWVVGGATGIVQIIRILFADSNRNNIPDIFEEQTAEVQEVTVTVSKGPEGGNPVVDVTQQVKQPE